MTSQPKWSICPRCDGEGYVTDFWDGDRRCSECDGLGGWHERREFPDPNEGGLDIKKVVRAFGGIPKEWEDDQ